MHHINKGPQEPTCEIFHIKYSVSSLVCLWEYF